MPDYNVKIICPQCQSIQDANVEPCWTWDVYIHKCTECKYIIMESEWNEIQNNKNLENENTNYLHRSSGK